MTDPTGILSLDFDGTLHGEEKPHVHPTLFAELARRSKGGVIWIVNTGRSLPHTIEGLTMDRFPELPLFVITREREIHRHAGAGRWEAFGSWNADCEHAHRELLGRAREFLHDVRDYLKARTLATFLELPDDPAGIVASNPAEMETICRYLDPLLPTVRDLRYERNSIWLRFGHRGSTKGSAPAHLAAKLAIPTDRVFAAGDNHNDLSMLDPAIAGHLACPSNAIPAVKKVVARHGGYIADQPASLGVAEALARLDW